MRTDLLKHGAKSSKGRHRCYHPRKGAERHSLGQIILPDTIDAGRRWHWRGGWDNGLQGLFDFSCGGQGKGVSEGGRAKRAESYTNTVFHNVTDAIRSSVSEAQVGDSRKCVSSLSQVCRQLGWVAALLHGVLFFARSESETVTDRANQVS